MDSFKCRAKLKGTNTWVYGAYLKFLPYTPNPVGGRKPLESEYKHLIITEGVSDWGLPRELASYEVLPETVGRCIGLKDRNDNLIYEGDKVSVLSEKGEPIAIIEWDLYLAGFVLNFDIIKENFDSYYNSSLEIVGNIHDK